MGGARDPFSILRDVLHGVIRESTEGNSTLSISSSSYWKLDDAHEVCGEFPPFVLGCD